MRKYAYPGLKDEIHTSIMITTGYLTWIHHLTQLNVGLERERGEMLLSTKRAMAKQIYLYRIFMHLNPIYMMA
jgi:hypothetical protein